MFLKEQKRIFEGLREIGEEISNFYADAVRMVEDDFMIASKANLIAHLAREIDGGLRNVLMPADVKDDEFTIACKSNEEKKLSHYESIIVSLGKDADDKLAKEWFSVAKHFSRIAHRHGPWKESKKTEEILGLWAKYESILLKLVGSFYGIIDRLDHIMKLEEPTPSILGMLSNVLRNPKYEWHFFANLKQAKWIKPLRDAGYFSYENAPKKEGNNVYPNEWLSIRCLANAAKDKEKSKITEIVEVYKTLSQDYLDGKFDLHPYTIASFSEILVNLDSYSFSERDKKVFEKFASTNPNSGVSIHESKLTEDLPNFYLIKNDKIGITNLLGYCFGYYVRYSDVQELTDSGFRPYPQIRHTLRNHYLRTFVERYSTKINLLLEIEGIHHLEQVIREIHKMDSFKFSSTAIPSIEPSSQTSQIHEWEDNILKFILNGVSRLSIEDTRSLIAGYLTSHIEIFRRIAFHLLREKFEVFKDMFFEFISNHPLDVNIPTHEPYVLLKERSPQFSDVEFTCVIDWIENLRVRKYYDPQTTEQLLQHKYYTIRKWLTSLNPANQNQKFILNVKLNHYYSLDQTEISHPEFDSYSQTVIGPEFPLKFDDFERMTLEEQIQYVNGYEAKENDFHSDEGLSQLLKAAVIKDPSKYIFKLDVFLQTPSLYLHNVLDAFTNVLNDDKITDFHLLLDFLEKRINDNSFRYENAKRHDYKTWFVSSVGTFVEALSKKNELYNFSNDDLIRITNLVLALIRDTEYLDCDDSLNHDYITHILNSCQGRLHIGLM